MPTNLLSIFSPTMGIIRLIAILILFIGSTRGAVLLLKDSMKHKGFAKVIRTISAVIWFLIILFTIIDGQAKTNIAGTFSIIGLVTNIRGGILLFIDAGKAKGFAKVIRIICGILMIGTILFSIIAGIVIALMLISSF